MHKYVYLLDKLYFTSFVIACLFVDPRACLCFAIKTFDHRDESSTVVFTLMSDSTAQNRFRCLRFDYFTFGM